MREVRARFSDDEVAAYAVSVLDSKQTIANWIEDTALRVPVIRDTSEDITCWEMPEGDTNLYMHFINRSVSDGALPPFPVQVIFAPDGTLAYISRDHLPGQVLDVLEALTSQGTDASSSAGAEGAP